MTKVDLELVKIESETVVVKFKAEFVSYHIELTKEIEFKMELYKSAKLFFEGLNKVGDKKSMTVWHIVGGSNLKNGMKKKLHMDFDVNKLGIIDTIRIIDIDKQIKEAVK